MAYAAVISLKQTIERLLYSSHDLNFSSPQIVESLYEDVSSLQQVLKELDISSNTVREKVNANLDGQIRAAVYEMEDLIESYVSSNQFISQSEDIHTSLTSFSQDFQELNQDIDSLTIRVNDLKAEYIEELQNPLPEKEEADAAVPSVADDYGGEDHSHMVGLLDQYMEIRDGITTNCSYLTLISLLGIAGIGKTTLAKKIFQDPFISSHFETRVFVTVGPKRQLEAVLQDICKQVDPNMEETMMIMEGEERFDSLKRVIYESLADQRYLIVLDDVWEKEILNFDWFSCTNDASIILMTTRLQQLAESVRYSEYYRIRFLDKKESWQLLCDKVFGDEESNACPPELEKAGKKIAENCEGHPLTILMVADNLSKADEKKTTGYWNKVAAEKQNPVFVDAYDRMFKVLYPSYNYLPQHLKPCFLYMGVFPQNYEVTCSRLHNLWTAEGIMDKDSRADIFVKELVSNSLVMVRKEKYYENIKTCALLSSIWYMCNKEAGKNKFFHGLNRLADGLAEESLKSQRRLCVRNNVLFGIKDVFDSMAHVSTVRSLLCTGLYHQYPVPICSGLRLLSVLDALTVRFYEFPLEFLTLVQLTYLAITFNGKLPTSISKLWDLHYLIVHRHLSIIKSDGNSSSLPIEIWDMKKLKHIQVVGSYLPHPPCEGSLLPSLLTLSDVSAHSCTKRIFERIPNLQKLGIRIELAPDAAEPLCCFDHISHLEQLKVLKCVVVNPKIMSEIVAPRPPLSIFSSSLKKLTLSGFGYPWNEMIKISSLPNLRVLKLLCYAFRGPKWVVDGDEFRSLGFLLIEDTDLEHWTTEDHFLLNNLSWLSIKQCYKLKEIPMKFSRRLEKIELVDCNPFAVTCAERLKDVWTDEHGYFGSLELNVRSSWDDGS